MNQNPLRHCPGCGRLTRGGPRAAMYCPRYQCSMAAVDLPQPTVDVTVSEPTSEANSENHHKVDVVLSRDGKARSYTSTAPSAAGAVKGVVEQILGDHHSAEFIPRK